MRTNMLEGRLWFGIVVLACAFALVCVSITSLQYLSRQTEAVGSLTPFEQQSVSEIYAPVEQKIEAQEKVLSSIKDPAKKQEQKEALAGLYQQLGSKNIGKGKLMNAEAALQKASDYDPNNPAYAAQLADLYEQAAASDNEKAQSAVLMSNAATNWEAAKTISQNVADRQNYARQEAEARVDAAQLFVDSGKSTEAKTQLQILQSIQVRDPEIQSAINKLTRSLNVN